MHEFFGIFHAGGLYYVLLVSVGEGRRRGKGLFRRHALVLSTIMAHNRDDVSVGGGR